MTVTLAGTEPVATVTCPNTFEVSLELNYIIRIALQINEEKTDYSINVLGHLYKKKNKKQKIKLDPYFTLYIKNNS